jgi:hypothetical protein
VLDRQADVAVKDRAAGGRRPLVWFAAAAVALVIAGLAVWLFTRGSTTSPRTGGPHATPAVSPTVPGRPAFFFHILSRPPAATGKRNRAAADDASVEIGSRLATFYDTVFMDPSTWMDGVPDDAWAIFDPSVADRAREDAKAFTLADRAPDLIKLSVTQSTLDVKVLLNPTGQPYAAIAEVAVLAVGTLQGGQTVNVTNHAELLLRTEGGQWFVVGYPSASTDVEGPAGNATATPTQSASP